MDNMNNHEAYICGWVTGKLESAARDGETPFLAHNSTNMS